MRFLDEFATRPTTLADHLPWAALVTPGTVLNKDGSFLACLSFRGPDLESATFHELMAVRARLNNTLRRLGTGWCLHMEARRRVADPVPAPTAAHPVAYALDAERRASLNAEGAAFETDYVASLTWLPPPDEAETSRAFLFENAGKGAPPARQALALFEREIAVLTDLLGDALPDVARLTDAGLLTYLHATISTKDHRVAVPETPVFLDALLTDCPLTGGIAPKLGDEPMRVVSVRSFPARTVPGLLDGLGALPFPYRWVVRWIGLDRAGAETELLRLRKRWFAKRKGLATLLREAIAKEEVPLIDTDATAKADECDAALATLGSEAAAFGWFTLTVTVRDTTETGVTRKARAIEAALNAQGFVARTEDLNAVEAWLGSLPGEPYADVRRPMISSLSLCDLLPVSAVWAGPRNDAHLQAPCLFTARTAGATPFRLSLHVGDVGHAMVVGPTGAGKSALLSFMALQWLRYPGARVVFFDKGRSARAATHAAGGRWHGLGAEPGTAANDRDAATGFALQPLARLETSADRAFAAEWLAATAETGGLALTPAHREAIWSALNALAGSPRPQRTLSVFAALCQDRAVTAALEPFTLKGPFGGLLDADTLPEAPSIFETFETEALMATPSAIAPVLTALFHEIEHHLDGAPVLLVLDEAWLFLGHAAFAARIRDWLKTLRKKNVAVVFATQSLDDVVASPIAATLIESCPTQILLPNPRALEPQSAALYGLFGLNDTQLGLIANAAPKRSYYIRQPGGRRLIDLRLEGLARTLCAATSPADQARLEAILPTLPAEDRGEAFTAAFGAAADGLPLAPRFDAPRGPQAKAAQPPTPWADQLHAEDHSGDHSGDYSGDHHEAA